MKKRRAISWLALLMVCSMIFAGCGAKEINLEPVTESETTDISEEVEVIETGEPEEVVEEVDTEEPEEIEGIETASGMLADYGPGNELPLPEVGKVKSNGEYEDEAFYHVYDAEKSDFKTYILVCRDTGFTEDPLTTETYYNAKRDDGWEIILEYHEDEDGKDYDYAILIFAPDEEE